LSNWTWARSLPLTRGNLRLARPLHLVTAVEPWCSLVPPLTSAAALVHCTARREGVRSRSRIDQLLSCRPGGRRDGDRSRRPRNRSPCARACIASPTVVEDSLFGALAVRKVRPARATVLIGVSLPGEHGDARGRSSGWCRSGTAATRAAGRVGGEEVCRTPPALGPREAGVSIQAPGGLDNVQRGR